MARMLGRWRTGGCGCKVPGPDCAGHERNTRWRKRVEQRQLQREFEEFADKARDWAEFTLPAAFGEWPDLDEE